MTSNEIESKIIMFNSYYIITILHLLYTNKLKSYNIWYIFLI